MWPIAARRLSAVLVVAAVALVLLPDSARTQSDRPARRRLSGMAAGALAALALVCYLFATRTQFLAVAVVLSSLYPIVPVLLGLAVLRERVRHRQILGLTASLAASVLMATA